MPGLGMSNRAARPKVMLIQPKDLAQLEHERAAEIEHQPHTACLNICTYLITFQHLNLLQRLHSVHFPCVQFLDQPHFTERAFPNDLDCPEIRQTYLCPLQP